MPEEKGSDGYFIIALIFFFVLIFSVTAFKVTNVLMSFVRWLFGLIIAFALLSLGIWLLNKFYRKMKFQTSAQLPLTREGNDISRNNELQLGLIEITALPRWADVSESNSLNELEELNLKHLTATESLIRNCMNSQLPFGFLIQWLDRIPKYFFWVSALKGEKTATDLLSKRLEQLDAYLKTSFPEMQTKCTISSHNPLKFIISPEPENKSQSSICFIGSSISGKHFLTTNNTTPYLNDLNVFMKREVQKRTVKGAVCFTFLPEKRGFFTRIFKKRFANLKYRRVTQNIQRGVTNPLLFGDRKETTNPQSILHQDKATRVVLEFEKGKATIINHVGILCLIATERNSKDEARKAAESYLQSVKGTLGFFVNPNREDSYQFHDFSQRELERQLTKLFFVDKYVLPKASECLSQEVALLIRLPNKATGLQITREEKSFLPPQTFKQPSTERFLLGYTRDKINDYQKGDGTEIYWSYKNLLKHTFITGATGGGKTVTICNLIKNASLVNIPTVILDFGKGELFTLLHDVLSKVKVFTIGDDSICPIRINPLECPDWLTPQQHFDNLKAILDASLPQFEPLPIVTYRALSKLYNSDGWNLGEGTKGSTRTLEDLLKAGLEVCDDAGYAEEVYMNMRGAWQMRINSLMEGSIGRQLFTERSIPIEELVNGNTILEIRTIESTAQKTITLTLLTKFFDYFKSLGPTQQERPRCLLVLDEAESIFASAEVFGNDIEMVTAAFKAVQKLNLILRQGRAYGLAVVIATQSPTNISHEIIANTENKIIHRLHHGKDKQIIQEALELTNIQTAKLSALKPGECYAVDGINEFPYFMKVFKPELAELKYSEKEKKQKMIAQMKVFYQKHPWLKEVYKGSPEEAFDRLFEKATQEVQEKAKLSKETRKRIKMTFERGFFQTKVERLAEDFTEGVSSEKTFYEELLNLLHATASMVIGENKDELKPAAVELLRNALDECLFVPSAKKKTIFETTRGLIYIDGGS